MQIDTGVLIGRKCAELADQLGRVLLDSRVTHSETEVGALNEVADMVCCGLNALHAASKAEGVEDFASSYDRACLNQEYAERRVRQPEQGVSAQAAQV